MGSRQALGSTQRSPPTPSLSPHTRASREEIVRAKRNAFGLRNSQMEMVLRATCSEAPRLQVLRRSCHISIELRLDGGRNHRTPVFS